MKIKIITDSCCDLSYDYIKENKLEVIPFPYSIDGNEYVDDFGKSLSYSDFYNELRSGRMPSTSQISVYTFEKIFKHYVSEGYSVIYLGFSSALSQTFNNSITARNTIQEEIPGADITLIDTKSASVGLGAIVFYANELLKQGKTKNEIINWVEENKLKSNHWFIIDSLDHLKRGGRISAASAAVGTILDVKPILNLDDEGRLNVVQKVRGRKKSIKALLDVLQYIKEPQEQTLFINHGDCMKEAEQLRELVLKEVNVKDVVINYVGPIIGSHTGPNMLCMVFMGEKR
ncbi:DegV family protein [Sedimentibacter hydroxybenzoicus DSM 7310]|uniref:DegV family protein n=1 Tax=Sedimentibacter hydroxybenzoicus DSM 7310 TaxID=1123245 RepID=A0A974BGR2_SEDHY|nr:DegV family protein [Sedimentibacter hydroxybenzoicus]NYB72874.1 DegV family protein [Sedimentibacter hydroxybenzoicus DSM 7310]